MERLPESYSRNSYDFKLIEREGDVAIYEQREPSNGRLLCYEVFIVIKQKEQTLYDGTVVRAKEITPSNSSWGQFGFSCWTLEAARGRRKELQAKIERLSAKNAPDSI